MTVYMRSNDICKALPVDVYGFRELQDYIGACTGYEPGIYTHLIGSAHIIEEHDTEFIETFLKRW